MMGKIQGLITLVGMWAIVSMMPMGMQTGYANHEALRCHYAVHFLRFTQWPEDFYPRQRAARTAAKKTPYMIGVVADPNWSEPLVNAGHVTQIGVQNWDDYQQWSASQLRQQLQACNILYISEPWASDQAKLIELAVELNVLTLGEGQSFLGQGGMVAFWLERDRLVFGVNVTALNQARLQMNPDVLRLARRIIRPQPRSD